MFMPITSVGSEGMLAAVVGCGVVLRAMTRVAS
jgi:hypothetical protein